MEKLTCIVEDFKAYLPLETLRAIATAGKEQVQEDNNLLLVIN